MKFRYYVNDSGEISDLREVIDSRTYGDSLFENTVVSKEISEDKKSLTITGTYIIPHWFKDLLPPHQGLNEKE